MRNLIPVIVCIVLLSCKNNDNTTSKKEGNDSDAVNRTIINNQAPNPYAEVDVSPMDMSYYPVDYPKLEMDGLTKTGPLMRVIYSRPHKGGRVIFGSLQKYGAYWRLGANEATEIEFYKPVTIQDKKIPVGRYVIYCIPEQSTWTIVLNKNNFTWGLKADSTKDFQRFVVPVKKIQPVEYFSMVFQKNGNDADLVMAWDDVEARLPIKLTE